MTGRAPTVLVVEDDLDLAETYRLHLTDRYRVRTAHSGDEAIEVLDDIDVDVVLLDRRMPGLSGEEVLEIIVERGYGCRVAMVTAVRPETEILGMQTQDYLVKPVGREELRQTVAQLLALAAHGDLVEEFVELSMKQAALETDGDSDLRGDEEYRQLIDRLGELSSTLGDLSGTLSGSELELFLEGLVRRLSADTER